MHQQDVIATTQHTQSMKTGHTNTICVCANLDLFAESSVNKERAFVENYQSELELNKY